MRLYAAALLTVLFASSAPSQAAWQENGIPMYSGPDTIVDTGFVTDDTGGGYFLRTETSARTRLFVTHFDAEGNVIWEVSVPSRGSSSHFYSLRAVSDGAGGVVICYYNLSGTRFSLMYNRILTDGSLPLGAGVQISTTSSAIYSTLIADGTSVYFAWQTSSTNGDIYCQKAALDGTIQWTAGEVPLSTAPEQQSTLHLVLDGTGGLIATWSDRRNLNRDVFAQRVDSAGLIVWTINGIPLCSDPATQSLQGFVSDGRGGAVATWLDYRTGTGILMVQRVQPTGNVVWTVDGILVNSSSSAPTQVATVALANGHTMVFWSEFAAGSMNILVQNLAPDGTQVLGSAGRVIASNLSLASVRIDGAIVLPSGRGAAVTWEGTRYGEKDVYVQRCDAAGNGIISAARLVVCAAVGDQSSSVVISDGGDGVFAMWRDRRNPIDGFYVQHLTGTGYWGAPAAPLTAVLDIPDDQGGEINMAWGPSRLDAYPANEVTYYTLWRSLPVAKVSGAAHIVQRPADRKSSHGEQTVLAIPGQDKAYFWEFMFTVIPRSLPGYGKTLPTPYDSVGVGSVPINYVVITETAADSVYFMSRPIACLSVDNLAPVVVKGLRGVVNYGTPSVNLVWHPNPEIDLGHYNLYRGTVPNFVPDAGTLVSAVVDTTFLDFMGGGTSFYRLAAVDIHGNEGPDVLLSPSAVSGIGLGVPAVLAIDGIAPNPFNPATTVSFNVRRAGPVRLEIYDVAGRRVRTLVDGWLQAGPGRAVWRGLDDNGRTVGSGAYLARLTDDKGSVTKALSLVK